MSPTDSIDYGLLLRANLVRVFNERDPGRRAAAIQELYAADAVLYEPDAVVRGQAAIGAAVDKLLAQLPPDFVFEAAGPALGHHGAGCMPWRGEGADGTLKLRGVDMVLLENGRIASLFVLIDAGAR